MLWCVHRALTCVRAVKRLNWILGGGFRCNRTGNLIDWRGDWRELSSSLLLWAELPPESGCGGGNCAVGAVVSDSPEEP